MGTELADIVQPGTEGDDLSNHRGLQVADIDANVTRHLASVVVDGQHTILGSLLVGFFSGGLGLCLFLALLLSCDVLLDLLLVLLALGLTLKLARLATADGLAISVQRKILGGGAGIGRAASHLPLQEAQWAVSGARAVVVVVSGSSVVILPAVKRATGSDIRLNGGSRVVERLTQPVDGAARSGGRGVFAGVVLAVECEGGEAGGGLADAAGALGVALGGAATVAVLGVGAAVVAGLKDLEGLFEGRHGGGWCVMMGWQ